MPTATTPHLRNRYDALTHAVRPSTWRSALAVDISRASVAVPIRVGIAVGAMLVIGGLTGQRDVAGFAALGALVSAFCRPDAYPVRAQRLAALGIGVMASVALGSAVGIAEAPVGVEIIVISLLGGVAALLVGMLHIVGPGAVIFVFAATGAAGFATDTADLTRAVLAASIGAACGVIASLAPWIGGAVRRRLLPRGRHHTTPQQVVAHASVWQDLRRRPRRDLVVNSLRIAVAAALSAVVASAIGLSHPMWAAMGAIAAMQGATYHVTVQRGAQRLLGNITGGLIAAGLLALGLNYWGAVVAIVICQTAAEIMSTANYAITSTAVTPMALLLTALGAGLSPSAAMDRVGDTLIGVVVGIVVAVITISRHELGRPDQRPAAATRA